MMPDARRSILPAALFVLLIAGSFRPPLLRLILPPHKMPDVAGPVDGIDRLPLRLRNDPTPEELRLFFAMTRLQVDRGRSVFFVLPPPYDGFSYAYWRAAYELDGRDVVLPVYNPATADYVAVWRTSWSDPQFQEIWSGFGGTVLKRK